MRKADQGMDDARANNPHVFALPEAGTRGRCAICLRRQREPLRLLVADGPVGDDQEPEIETSTWLTCAGCAEAIEGEITRAGLQTPHRVRVAVGLIAAQRNPRQRPSIWSERYWDEMDNQTMSKLINWFIVGLIVLKTLAFIAIVVLVAYVH